MRKKSSKKEKKSSKRTKHEYVPEYIDWIDEKGNIIGPIDKRIAHQHGFFHLAGHVFVFDASKKLILQYRSHTKRIYPQCWDTSVGGHVQAGESIHAGTKREAWEELGIKTKIHLLGHADCEDTETNSKGTFHHKERVYYYYSILPKKYRIKPNEEFEKIAFLRLDELPAFIRKNKFTKIFKNGWKKYRKQLTRVIKQANF